MLSAEGDENQTDLIKRGIFRIQIRLQNLIDWGFEDRLINSGKTGSTFFGTIQTPQGCKNLLGTFGGLEFLPVFCDGFTVCGLPGNRGDLTDCIS